MAKEKFVDNVFKLFFHLKKNSVSLVTIFPFTFQEQKQAAVSQTGGEEVEENVDTDMLIKHPLQNQWTLWFFKPDRTKGWEENQREVINFDTIEDFWS